ncbi:MAG TPA: hypothetical protein VFF16_02325, partial [Telluria sp.]|nr:hypothetical protein [Telluria sp.]
GCGGGSSSQPAPPPPPPAAAPVSIASFAAENGTVDAGQGALLRWQVDGAASVSITPGVGDVTGKTSVAVSPDLTTAYTLTAVDAQGKTVRAAFTVNVNQKAPAPAAYPILFVTQVPMFTDDAARLSAFANHLTGLDKAPRGGDLWIRYPDGSLRNLTREAGYGSDGAQGASAIAVREPSVDWSGTRAVFSMLVGAPTGPGQDNGLWQLYEVTGLGKGEHAVIAKVPGQPAYNNLSPLYATDGRILFTSDRPRTGGAHLYPQLDEYEATPTTTGIWSLDPSNGALRLVSNAVSGAFSPIEDSYGRIVFTRWDHLQQDQLAQRDRDAEHNGVALPFNSFNYAGEEADAAPTSSRAEVFPESRSGESGPYGEVSPFTANFFAPWQINEDGTGEETLNHVGLHELSFGFLTPSFKDDPALTNRTLDGIHANTVPIRREGGLFHLREDPRQPGTYFATVARESDSFTTGQIVKLTGSPALNGEQMAVTEVTEAAPSDFFSNGRYRNPLPLADGTLVASHTTTVHPPDRGSSLDDLRLVRLVPDGAGKFVAGEALTPGLSKQLTWWTPAGTRSWNGPLWELEAVEVRPRARPQRAPLPLEAPERAVLAAESVDEAELRTWLASRELALIVTRDQTSRDRADLQQPFNLEVPGGRKTVSKAAPDARVYPIAHFQVLEGEQLRAYPGRPGRRVIAQPLKTAAGPANPAGPQGSVRIAADGSTAAFVPAGRALTWQTTDPNGTPVVRERNWITFQPGEIRTCASCHGVNSVNQAGFPTPQNQPQALRDLLRYWKALPKN